MSETASENPDQFPSAEEVERVLKAYLGNVPYVITKSESDEAGVVAFDVETMVGEEKTEYYFRRAKYDHTQPSIAKSGRFSASIHSLLYDTDGMPQGGKCLKNFVDGVWSEGTNL